MQRIIIIGATGSGKTTLGKKLSERLNMPALDLDEFNWLPGWQERPLEEARRMVNEATQQRAWVISGNYSKLQDIFWARADTLVWLDYSFARNFWQLLKRSVLRAIEKNLICNGNIERWSNFFSRKSIMLWFFQSFWRRRRKGKELFEHPEKNPHFKNMLRFRHPDETARWLESLPHGTTVALLAA